MAVKLDELEKLKRAASRAYHDMQKRMDEFMSDPSGSPPRADLPEILRGSKMGRPPVPFRTAYERSQQKYDKAILAYRQGESTEGVTALHINMINNHLNSGKSAAGRATLDELGQIEKYQRRKQRQLKAFIEDGTLPYAVVSGRKKKKAGRAKRSADEIRTDLEKNIEDAENEIRIRVKDLSALESLEYRASRKRLEISLNKALLKKLNPDESASVLSFNKSLSDECKELNLSIKAMKKEALKAEANTKEDQESKENKKGFGISMLEKKLEEDDKARKEALLKKRLEGGKKNCEKTIHKKTAPKKTLKQLQFDGAKLIMDIALVNSGQKIEGDNESLNSLDEAQLKTRFKEAAAFLGL